ncbi:CoA transferase [Nonomuraea insulae]|uniref:CoA transferase n=1 Tax=Nonomuraea insulae TaxID=1616787 RepID=A0ABW1CG20_9ACTN
MNAQRAASRDPVERAFAGWGADDLLERLHEMGIPAGRVRTLDEVCTWEQTLSQGALIDVTHETLGTLTLPGPPLRCFEPSRQERTWIRHRPPPILDQYREPALRWVGAEAS